jgi:hypothetical protein
MNSFEHPTSNKEFPTSNEIGHSVFYIGYSSLKLIAMGNAQGAEPPPKHRPERAEPQRKPCMFSPYRAELPMALPWAAT